MSPVDVVIASNNPGKLREFAAILSSLQLVPQGRLNVPEVEETGGTFRENALLKARHAARYTGLPAIADDSGLEVDTLSGEPGIFSARYAGSGASDADNLRLLLERIAELNLDSHPARFQCEIVYVESAQDSTPIFATGTWEGLITSEPAGENGFGYDPVFYLPDHRCTSAQLPAEEKNRISHRAKALNNFLLKFSERQPDL